MRIQPVNNTIKFGRVIEIKSATDSEYSPNRIKLDSSTYKICDILNSKNVTGYSKEEQKSIRSFFKDILEDYNGYGGILMKRFDKNRIALISGTDCDYFNKMEKRYKNDIRYLYNKDDEKIQKRKSKYYKDFDCAVQKNMENGKNKNSIALIEFDSNQLNTKRNKQKKEKSFVTAKIDKFKYTLFNQVYQFGEDGHNNENGLITKKDNDKNAYAVVKYYEKELNL